MYFAITWFPLLKYNVHVHVQCTLKATDSDSLAIQKMKQEMTKIFNHDTRIQSSRLCSIFPALLILESKF